MDKNEILKRAIEKAFANGWKYGHPATVEFLTEDWERPAICEIIFSHDFAKAFARYLISSGQANKLLTPYEGQSDTAIEYLKDKLLLAMVLESDRLKYLERYL